jgi:hypothetical protein
MPKTRDGVRNDPARGGVAVVAGGDGIALGEEDDEIVAGISAILKISQFRYPCFIAFCEGAASPNPCEAEAIPSPDGFKPRISRIVANKGPEFAEIREIRGLNQFGEGNVK